MKITVLKTDLAKTLNVVSRFTSSRAQLPIIGNILIKAKGAKLIIQATNLEMSISTHIGAKVDEEGEITLPSKSFTDLINSISSNQIELLVANEILNIKAEGVNTSITGVNTADFPVIPEAVENVVTVNGEDFSDSLMQVLFSASPDDTRPALSGLLIDLGLVSSFVTSDGFRLSKKDLKIEGISQKRRLILPKQAMGEVLKIIKETKKDVSFKFDEENSQVLFQIGDYLLSTRIVEGEYPNFEKIIPDNSRIVANLSRGDLLSSLKTISVIAREAANIARFEFSENGLTIKSENQKGGAGELTVPASVSGGAISISYNYKYLIDFLNIINSENISIELNDASSPGVFKEEGSDNYLHLIMPVRV